MSIVVTGSIAFDYLMSFPGKFTEHFLPEHMSRVSLSFLVDSMDKRRGGCAPNIAYTLALLGETPRLMATAGQDFDDYRRWLEAAGVDTSLVREVAGKFTASFFCSTDTESNQIASFYTGAMANAGELSFRGVDGLRAGDHLAERSRRDGAVCRGMPDARHPVHLGSRASSARGCRARSFRTASRGPRSSSATTTSSSCIRQKTSIDEDSVLEHTQALVITRGENGCSIYTRSRPQGCAGGAADAHRRSDRRRRRVPGRVHEGA